MDKIEKIRQEIEKELSAHDKVDHLEAFEVGKAWSRGHKAALETLKSFIDSLPDENNPEPYNPVYNEDYLNEKIAKATKSWEGVDVDKMLADCRGYEEKPSEDLEDAAEKYSNVHYYETMLVGDLVEGFKAGAEWQKEKMMKDAVESNVVITSKGILLSDLLIEDFNYEDKVRIVVLKEEEE